MLTRTCNTKALKRKELSTKAVFKTKRVYSVEPLEE